MSHHSAWAGSRKERWGLRDEGFFRLNFRNILFAAGIWAESSHLGRTPPSVGSAPSRGAPVSDDPRNRARPLGSVKFRPFALSSAKMKSDPVLNEVVLTPQSVPVCIRDEDQRASESVCSRL